METPINSCPCHSGQAYRICCAPLHKGDPADSVDALMRSRYSAYALALADYIIETTHPENPLVKPIDLWRQELIHFSKTTDFLGLEILEIEQYSEHGMVLFSAKLASFGRDCSFIERSAFVKEKGKWLYQRAISLSQNS